jgi:hypothetical protein
MGMDSWLMCGKPLFPPWRQAIRIRWADRVASVQNCSLLIYWGGLETQFPARYVDRALSRKVMPDFSKGSNATMLPRSGLGPGCVKTRRGIVTPGILSRVVTRRTKKSKNSSSAPTKSHFVFAQPGSLGDDEDMPRGGALRVSCDPGSGRRVA